MRVWRAASASGILTALAIEVLWSLLGAARVEAQAPAPSPDCVQPLVIQRLGNVVSGALESPVSVSAFQGSLELNTASEVYTASLKNLPLDQRDADSGAYVSPPFRILVPAGEPVRSVRIVQSEQCRDQAVNVPYAVTPSSGAMLDNGPNLVQTWGRAVFSRQVRDAAACDDTRDPVILHGRDALFPDAAPIAQAAGTARVKVVLDRDGIVKDASLEAPSPDPQLNAAAVDAMKQTTFLPQLIACRPTPGTYHYNVRFTQTQVEVSKVYP